MACQRARRASSGWADSRGCGAEEEGLIIGVRLARRVSWMPGAEGAPGGERVDVEMVVRFVAEEGWGGAGAMRRDCGGWGISELFHGDEGLRSVLADHVVDVEMSLVLDL